MNELKNVLLKAVREAGDAVLNLQRTGFSVARKTNNDIVTQGDYLANEILKKYLLQACPDAGWLSEESIDEKKRLNCAKVFIVDPIDGTQEYASGIPEYALSVALVEHGKPVLSAVFNPATQQLFHASSSGGAWLWEQKIQCINTKSHSQRLHLLASRSEYLRGEWQAFAVDHDVEVVGSIAYKLALVAMGKAHATFSLGPKNEWDIAAGVLLVTEAFGIVTNKIGNDFIFNQEEVRVNGIVAAAAVANDEVGELIKKASLIGLPESNQ